MEAIKAPRAKEEALALSKGSPADVANLAHRGIRRRSDERLAKHRDVEDVIVDLELVFHVQEGNARRSEAIDTAPATRGRSQEEMRAGASEDRLKKKDRPGTIHGGLAREARAGRHERQKRKPWYFKPRQPRRVGGRERRRGNALAPARRGSNEEAKSQRRKSHRKILE
jgi:hypothetical protein